MLAVIVVLKDSLAGKRCSHPLGRVTAIKKRLVYNQPFHKIPFYSLKKSCVKQDFLTVREISTLFHLHIEQQHYVGFDFISVAYRAATLRGASTLFQLHIEQQHYVGFDFISVAYRIATFTLSLYHFPTKKSTLFAKKIFARFFQENY